jgi:hypothetical protein
LDAVVVPQVPPFVVSVRVAVPKYAKGGVHVALRVVAFGIKVPPAGVDQVPPIAEPPTVPPKGEEVPPRQIWARAAPALAVGSALTVSRPGFDLKGQPPCPGGVLISQRYK